MRSVLFNRLLAIVVAGTGLGANVGLAGAQPVATSVFEGSWSGTLSQASDKLRIVVEIKAAADGRLSGTVNGFDQGNTFAIDAIEQNGTTVRLAVGATSGGFEGTLSGDGTKLIGAWSQLAISTPLELVRSPAPPLPSSK